MTGGALRVLPLRLAAVQPLPLPIMRRRLMLAVAVVAERYALFVVKHGIPMQSGWSAVWTPLRYAAWLTTNCRLRSSLMTGLTLFAVPRPLPVRADPLRVVRAVRWQLSQFPSWQR